MNCFGYINNAAGYGEHATRLHVDPAHPFRGGQMLLVPRTRESLYVTDWGEDWIRVQRDLLRSSALVDDDVLVVAGDGEYLVDAGGFLTKAEIMRCFKAAARQGQTRVTFTNFQGLA